MYRGEEDFSLKKFQNIFTHLQFTGSRFGCIFLI